MPFDGRIPSQHPSSFAAIAGAVCLALLAALAAPCLAGPGPNAAASAATPSVARTPNGKTAASAPKQLVVTKRVTKPTWAELTPAQRQALAPLAGTWDTVSEAQKRKWIALSEGFPRLSPPEQAKLHSRMTEWVALSPAQRTQARLNFGETKQLAPDDKKAKWAEYQALSPEEKKKLAARAAKPPATAAAVKPVAPEKLATLPKTPKLEAKAPRIAVAPAGEQNPAAASQSTPTN